MQERKSVLGMRQILLSNHSKYLAYVFIKGSICSCPICKNKAFEPLELICGKRIEKAHMCKKCKITLLEKNKYEALKDFVENFNESLESAESVVSGVFDFPEYRLVGINKGRIKYCKTSYFNEPISAIVTKEKMQRCVCSNDLLPLKYTYIDENKKRHEFQGEKCSRCGFNYFADDREIRTHSEYVRIIVTINNSQPKILTKSNADKLKKDSVTKDLNEKKEKQLFYKNNLFCDSEYRNITLLSKDTFVTLDACRDCNSSLLEKCYGMYNEQKSNYTSLRVKACVNCSRAYILCPVHYALPLHIYERADREDDVETIYNEVKKWGIVRTGTTYAENIEKGIYISIGYSCAFDFTQLQKKEKANFLVQSKNRLQSINAEICMCKKCNRYMMRFEQYNRLQERGIVIADIYNVNRSGDFWKPRIRIEQIRSKNVLENQLKLNDMKENITWFGYSQKEKTLVRNRTKNCSFDETVLSEITAKLLLFTEKKEYIELEFPALYCKYCNHFFMHEETYKKVLSIGIPQCRILTKEQVKKIENKFLLADFSAESILYKYGYNVSANNNLSREYRQSILYNLVANSILTRWEIIEHLDFLIRFNQGKDSFGNAISKWREDIDYINTLQLDCIEAKTPETIVVKRKIKWTAGNIFVDNSH